VAPRPDPGAAKREGSETWLAPIRRSGSRGLVPLVELSRGSHGEGTARRAGPERLGQPLGVEDVAHGERVLAMTPR
jgi:hypothetical protein